MESNKVWQEKQICGWSYLQGELQAGSGHPVFKVLSLDFISSLDFSCGYMFSMILAEERIFLICQLAHLPVWTALSGICRWFSCPHGRLWLLRGLCTALCSFFQGGVKCQLNSTLQWKASKTHPPLEPLILASSLFTGTSCCWIWPWLVFANSRTYEWIFLSYTDWNTVLQHNRTHFVEPLKRN